MLKDGKAITYMVEVLGLLSGLRLATGGRIVEHISAKYPGTVGPSYLRKILCKMSTNRLIRSHGVDGYSLAMKPEEVTLATLLAACGDSIDVFTGADTIAARAEKKLRELAEQIQLSDLM